MTREEAIELKAAVGRLMYSDNKDIRDYNALIDFIDTALRPVSREQVEKVWRGGWTPGDSICPICEKNKFDGLDADIWADWMPSFCPNCGAPMTDEAVEMVMERLEALKDGVD